MAFLLQRTNHMGISSASAGLPGLGRRRDASARKSAVCNRHLR